MLRKKCGAFLKIRVSKKRLFFWEKEEQNGVCSDDTAQKVRYE